MRGTSLLDSLKVRPGLSKDHSALNSLNDLQETFAHFFSRGAAAERPFQNEDIFAQIIEQATSLNNVHVRILISSLFCSINISMLYHMNMC